MPSAAYFTPLGPSRYRPTEHVGGAWALDEQHVAPALGLLCHAVEQDRDRRRGADVRVARLSYDILGPMPLEPMDVEVRVVRPGRTIELVEAALSCAGRVGVLLRAWLMQSHDSASVAGSDLPPMPAPGSVPEWKAAEVWPGGFIASAEVRRTTTSPGRGQVWVRTETDLVAGEKVSPTAAAAGLLDIANGMNVRAQPEEILFPNVDLTAHLLRTPQPGWLGLDTTVSFGADGLGLTSSVLHDEAGPLGSVQQCLTVRPRQAS